MIFDAQASLLIDGLAVAGVEPGAMLVTQDAHASVDRCSASSWRTCGVASLAICVADRGRDRAGLAVSVRTLHWIRAARRVQKWYPEVGRTLKSRMDKGFRSI
jgi:hypothetical protein